MKPRSFLNNTFWVIGSKVLQSIIMALVGIFVTRNLTPKDFAIFASMHVVIGVLTVLSNMGFSYIIIQSKGIYRKIPSIFLFQFGISILFYLIAVLVIQPLLVNIYSLHEIDLYFNFYAIIIIAISLSAAPKAIISKERDFKFFSIAEFVVLIFGSILAVYLIVCDFGIYALLIPAMAREILMSIIVISKTKKWLFGKIESINVSISNFNLVAAQFINTIILNIENYSLGAMFSPQTLGFFNRAKALENLFSSNIAVSLGTVSFPHLSTITDKTKLFNTLKSMLGVIASISFPFLIFSSYYSYEIVTFLFGNEWLMTGQFLRYLSIAALPIPIYQVLSGYILSNGAYNYTVIITVLNLALNIAVFLIVPLFFNVQAVLIGIVCIQYVLSFWFWIFSDRVLPFKSVLLFKHVVYKVVSPLISIIVVHLIMTRTNFETPFMKLIVAVPFYFILHLTTLYIIDNKQFNDLKIGFMTEFRKRFISRKD